MSADLRYKNHNELVNRILILLHSNQLGRFWNNPTGSVLAKSGRFHRFGLKGSSDIIGLSSLGQFIAIEIKTGTGRQSKDQVAFANMITKNGGIYQVIHSEEEFHNILLPMLTDQ